MKNRPSIRDILSSGNTILVLDGAMGTAIQSRNLSAPDFGGEELEGCNENLVLTRPDVIKSIHLEYLDAGCDIVETNTFGATPLVLAEYGLEHKAREINLAAARLAREAADQLTTPTKPRFVAGSIGPTTKAISVTGGVTFDALIDTFEVQAEALWDGGVDYLLLETCQDTRNIKAALLAIDRVEAKKGQSIPVAVSGTIEPTGTMLAGQTVEALLTSLANRKLLYLGLNCATGPEFMTDSIRTLAKLSPFPIACVPNAGLPDENGCYLENPEMVAGVVRRFIQNGWVNLIGGCCGTHSGHIAALSREAKAGKARSTSPLESRSQLSGIDYLEITDEMRPILVGERTNVIGSKKFKTLITEDKFDEASEVARAQVKNGAQIIDVCLANPDRNELEDMRSFMELASKKIRVPIMIDSTDEKVIELALTYCQGKAIINSINLEDGEERFEKVLPLAKRYGAALVVGCIDDDKEQGMGVDRKRKLEIATRSYKLLTEKYGIPEEDIYWDPLVFPCATGDAQYVGSAIETIEGVRLIKQAFPRTKTVLGISNVSFGLPASGREVLNSVFLYHCVQAGLDLAIVNSEKLERFSQIAEHERVLSENLLFNKHHDAHGAPIDPIAAFAAFFRQKKVEKTVAKSSLTLNERLAKYIVEGSKDGLYEDLDAALKLMPPLEIINGPLMKGMDEVGKLFNANQLIVAEVLQSAEAMKASVGYLEPYMEKASESVRGKVLLATVKGDVHDIGKNLVEIILSNNGFKVINLGIKVPPEQLISAVREHKPDMVGLSGLLVKSAQQMVITAEDLNKAGVDVPILVGGAALSRGYVDRHISKAYSGTVAYAQDAMSGLDLAKTIVDKDKFEQFKTELDATRTVARAEAALADQNKKAPVVSQGRSPSISILDSLPTPPDFERHILRNTPIEHIWNFINPLMLYGRHLGIKGGVVRQLAALKSDPSLLRELEKTEPKALSIYQAVESVKEDFGHTPLLAPSAVYQFFKASSFENKISILRTDSNTPVIFEFPRQDQRQNGESGLCLSDYVQPVSKPGQDSVALFNVSVGRGVREMAEQLKVKGDYLRSHILQVLALESAEAYAEYLHSQIRKMWGFSDPPEMTMMERFQAKYRGKRYSFGYPACPRLDDQAILFSLLRPQEIGVQLTEGFMMDPEASVSAIVFHHPQATYYSVGQKDLGAGDDNRQ